MKVEIWSDIMCPFCYIGKRQFEAALDQFPDRERVLIRWKSYQLDPTIPEITEKDSTSTDYLAERKGLSPDRIEAMQAQVTAMAKNVGLEYHLDNSKVFNSFKAHRILQLAQQKGLGDKGEEVFFHAHFTLNSDLGDEGTLLDLGQEVGLSEQEIREALTAKEYAELVRQDISEARQIGVTGVPFFVFNRKYAISGAQPASVFLDALKKSFDEWRADTPEIQMNTPPIHNACTPDGDCH